MIASFSLLLLPPLAAAHSWVQSPEPRGGTVGGDLELQRLYCPLDTLEECQPEAKHGIILTPDAMRPCRAGQKSNPVTQVTAGGTLRVRWAGNGHANRQSDGTCVRIQIAPFESDPDRSAFTTIPGAECLIYHRGGSNTEATITIPADTPNGEHTLFWLWDFLPFWYASCMDINVSGGSGAPAPPPAPAPTQPPAPPVMPTVPMEEVPTFAPPPAAGGDSDDTYFLRGCAELQGYCETTFGTFCRTFQSDSCGRSICHGEGFSGIAPCVGGQVQGGGASQTPAPTTTTTTTTPPPPSTSGPDEQYFREGCGGLPRSYCRETFGSFCRSWQANRCGQSVCHGDTHSNLQPCP